MNRNTSTTLETEFTFDATNYDIIGYHATTEAVSDKIAREGLYPSKLLEVSEHEEILREAIDVGGEIAAEIADYREWLNMRSVSFTMKPEDAKSHVRAGNTGGQGLKNILRVLNALEQIGSERLNEIVENYRNRIDEIRGAMTVIYALDLSHLKGRIVQDERRPFYHLYWNPTLSFEEEQLLPPDRIIQKIRFPAS